MCEEVGCVGGGGWRVRREAGREGEFWWVGRGLQCSLRAKGKSCAERINSVICR